MVKQVLLGIAAVLSEVISRKSPELCGRRFAFAPKILLPQNTLDPDVDWKRAETLKGKQHDAVRYFGANTGKGA